MGTSMKRILTIIKYDCLLAVNSIKIQMEPENNARKIQLKMRIKLLYMRCPLSPVKELSQTNSSSSSEAIISPKSQTS